MGQMGHRLGAFRRLFTAEVEAPPPPSLPELPFGPATPAKAPVDCASVMLSPEERVRKAFQDTPLNSREKQAVKALLDAPGSTATELSTACGWLATGWRTQMLLLCQRRRRNLWPGGMASDITNGLIIMALADYDPETLQFHPRKALRGVLQGAVAA